MKSWILSILLAVSLFLGISWYKERGLLAQASAAPAFIAVTLEGELFRSAQLLERGIPEQQLSEQQIQGQKTLLYFFAPWCGICRLSMPNLKYLQADNEGLAVYAIALQYDSAEQVSEFIADLDLQVPVLLGNQQMATDYQIQAFPTYYVIDENGHISAKSLGYSTALGLWLRSR
ncbi:thioredoxin [Alishewanella longhuensis]|uniref:Thioredoxin n=1 Tax=Alishewanella longhuensis TaxID=1091037 RepID=A0ABQ3KVK3_9ALTE|nr:TlpA disulfide reductase family protein [Alishewanella longhuensis]GHG60943.1 thioredoxin [Alishewanella longhuensis]